MRERASALVGKGAAVLFWVAVWLVAAACVDNAILLAGPGETLAALASRLVDASFWGAVARTGSLVVGVVLASAVAGAVLGMAAARFAAVETLLAPAMQVVKSAPVACVVVILLVALGSRGAVAAIVVFVALPPFYVAALEAAAARPRDFEAVLRLLGLARPRVFAAATWPACLPLFTAAAKTSVALAWRAGVTAELLGIPLGSIGAGVYASKLTLDTAGLLAWTIAVMALAWLSEKAAVALLGLTGRSPRLALPRSLRRREAAQSGVSRGNASAAGFRSCKAAECRADGSGCSAASEGSAGPVSASSAPGPSLAPVLAVSSLRKAYGGQVVLDGVSLSLAAGERVCLMAPTGAGKTTLLRILLGIDQPDAGTVARPARCGCMLQETCLVESMTALENVLLAVSPQISAPVVRAQLDALLPSGCVDKPARELSGGTRRLTEIARAVFSDAPLLVLDEPFAGLDERTHERACAFIADNLGGRALVVATHDARDAELLQAAVIALD
ncbi:MULTISPECIES: ATP-binding cassette domain-containing protein [unclassified Adlercreutzia]|uniref:ATP-binding cassette domain-containing protein n=1 Tax=unclassified Adlercreutzia TaxID=2636013 RepID=UPI0013ED0F3C|nr:MULTISPECIES: ATP-binding cassette domain-containing protein [unclassified Adlercreutzia]